MGHTSLRSLLGLMAMLFAVSVFAQDAQPGTPPYTGAMGVSETVADIMARQATLPEDQTLRMGWKPKRIRPDRSALPQNPESPEVASWPKATTGYAPPMESPQTLGVNFLGATLSGTYPTYSFPPDVMGDVGPTQYIVAVNGRIISFNKTTGVADGAINAGMDNFFNSVRNGTYTSDPRIRFDRQTGRWFVIIINVASINNRILFAVSNTGVISGSTVWTFYYLQHDLVTPAGNTNEFADYPTLGIDANALYIGANMFSSGGSFSNVSAWVVRKSSITGGGPIVATAFRNLLVAGTGPYTPQGVDNFDPAATQGYFIGTDAATYGRLMLRRVSDPGGTPTISSNISITVPATFAPLNVRHLGNTGGTNGYLSAVDDRLFHAFIRNGRLWTVHNVRVNNTGVSGSGLTRNGARWYEIQNLTGTPSIVQSGTVFTATPTNTFDERNYWMPSIMVSGQGHAAMGFSTAGTNEYANCATVGRLAGDALGTMQTPVLFTASTTAYNPPGDPGSPSVGRRWGDYSYTSVDPNDDMTMYTAQMYCYASNSYAVRVVKLIAPPPATPASVVPAAVSEGLPSVSVTVTGTQVSGSGFFDPGAGFPNRITASVSGSVTVNSVTYVNPTTVVLDLSTVGAATGTKDVTVTNPDGQAQTGTGILTVSASTASVQLVEPDGGELWAVGTVQDIQWSSIDLAGNVKIELSRDGGATFPEVLFASTPNDGSQAWTVTGPRDSTVRIRISSILLPSVADTSGGDLTILAPEITVQVPDGGELWLRDSTYAVTWNTFDLPGDVTILLSRDGGAAFPETLFAATANDGSEAWTVTGPATAAARIRVAGVDYPATADASDSSFTIAVPTVSLLTPAGGDTLFLDSVTTVGWTSQYFGDSLVIALSRDGGVNYALIAASANDGSEDIILTGAGTTEGRIRLSAVADSTVVDETDGLLVIGRQAALPAFADWNLVSLPVTVGDARKTAVFPTAASPAFAFVPGAGYLPRDTMAYGVGYWVKFPGAQTLNVFGLPRTADTLEVHAGWNIIGMISGAVAVDSVGQDPPGIVTSQFYAYNGPGAGYEAASVLEPMRAYWVKTAQDGVLILRTTGFIPRPAVAVPARR